MPTLAKAPFLNSTQWNQYQSLGVQILYAKTGIENLPEKSIDLKDFDGR